MKCNSINWKNGQEAGSSLFHHLLLSTPLTFILTRVVLEGIILFFSLQIPCPLILLLRTCDNLRDAGILTPELSKLQCLYISTSRNTWQNNSFQNPKYESMPCNSSHGVTLKRKKWYSFVFIGRKEMFCESVLLHSPLMLLLIMANKIKKQLIFMFFFIYIILWIKPGNSDSNF